LPNGFSETTLAANLGSTTAMAVAPDGRVFVATQSGDVKVIKNGAVLSTPFVHFNDIDSSGERGALGVAFDPNFTSNQFVYIYHTIIASGTAAAHNEVTRFTANGDVADPSSKEDILQLNDLSSATNHNGGAMHFGKDNKLYIDVGENANPPNSQTLNNLLGKVLRIDVSQIQLGDPVNDVAKLIPSDNPFTPGHTNVASGINQAIYALGFRNPFTFGVDPISGTIPTHEARLMLPVEAAEGHGRAATAGRGNRGGVLACLLRTSEARRCVRT
jgi:glucose/arabinose dehydrogenase